MSPTIAVLVYLVLMLVLAVIVRWEFGLRRKGPSLKPGDLQRSLGGPAIPYSPPPRDRSRRSLDALRTAR
ncbi:MAG TPA: hypothetical protein VGF59_33680 [Bryobacteraceae bacterium]|jgi:hypothetical protein